MQTKNEKENFTEQANKLIDKIRLHYGDKDCEFYDTEMTKIVFNKREVWYNYHSLVHETLKNDIVELEEIALGHDDKGEITYLNYVIAKINLLRDNNPLYKLEGSEETLHKELFIIQRKLWRYKMKLVWFFLPSKVKSKRITFTVLEEYGNRISNTTRADFLKYLTNKYM